MANRLAVLSCSTIILLIYFHNLIDLRQLINLNPVRISLVNLSSSRANIKFSDNNNKISATENNFLRTFRNFPWENYELATNHKNQSQIDYFSEKLMNDLTPYLILEPTQAINESCSISQVKIVDVTKLHPNCSIRTSPVKIGMLLQFGFEVDTLEIHLNELYDLVNMFFIVESTRAHFNSLRKPLIWELIRKQKRFEKFLDKVTHIVVDDVDIEIEKATRLKEFKLKNPFEERMRWNVEDIQEIIRWEKFVRWNNVTGHFNENDLIGFGDTDEVPSRKTIHILKTCEVKLDPIDIGIWFPFGNIHQAFTSDFPVPNFPFTLGDPTFWKLSTALAHSKNGTIPSRNRGKSPQFLLGGMHMSHYGYLPLRLVQKLSATERGITDVGQLKEFSDKLKEGRILELEKELSQVPSHLLPRVVYMESASLHEVKETQKKIAFLPWFYDCNRLRYPSWEGGHDYRTDL